MIRHRTKPRILIITPEVTYLPDRMATISGSVTAKAGGLADVSAALINALFTQGADVHVAIPDYRAIFNGRLAAYLKKEQQTLRRVTSDDRVHLAADRAFYYLNNVYSDHGGENSKISLAFQREVINNLIPRIRPDLIHCNDWMTGLIPAMAKKAGTPSLFTIHNVHSVKTNLEIIEDRGIDAANFWDNLYYDFPPSCYEEARKKNVPINFLVSGVFAADFVNVVSPTFLKEIVDGRHGFIDYHLRRELSNKYEAGCAVGILNAPDSTWDPETDDSIFSEPLERMGYAASDFIFMPSLFEPCGLPQMTATKYGSLPIACDTGGLHDTISHLEPENNTGNGFLFKIFDSAGLFWAIDQAMAFYKLGPEQKKRHIRRIMKEGKEQFNHENCAKQYIDLYQRMLRRPVINPSGKLLCESLPECIAL